MTWVNFLLTALLVRGQGYRDDGEDVRLFRKAVFDGKVAPTKSLLLRAALLEARTVGDPAGNHKLAKNTQGERSGRCGRSCDLRSGRRDAANYDTGSQGVALSYCLGKRGVEDLGFRQNLQIFNRWLLGSGGVDVAWSGGAAGYRPVQLFLMMRCACLGVMPSSSSSDSQYPCRVLAFARRSVRARSDLSPSSNAIWMAAMSSCGGRGERSRRRPTMSRLASSNVSGTATPAISPLTVRFCFAVAFIMPR